MLFFLLSKHIIKSLECDDRCEYHEKVRQGGGGGGVGEGPDFRSLDLKRPGTLHR